MREHLTLTRIETALTEAPYKPKKKSIYFLYHILVIFVCLIFFCSWKMPYINASDVGGQPGT